MRVRAAEAERVDPSINFRVFSEPLCFADKAQVESVKRNFRVRYLAIERAPRARPRAARARPPRRLRGGVNRRPAGQTESPCRAATASLPARNQETDRATAAS